MLLAIHGFTILLFLGLGWLFRREKGAFLISGYNTAPKAEKEKYDLKKLYRHMSRLMFLLAGCWAILALGMPWDRIGCSSWGWGCSSWRAFFT